LLLCAPLALLAGVLALALPVEAAEPHGTDLFAGYSFAQVDDLGRHGGDVAVAFDLFGPVDGFVDASTHWGSQGSLGLNDLTLMAGPGARFGKRGGTVVFLRVLAGLVRDRSTISVLDVDISESASRFGVLAGGGVDFRVARSLAVRVQADYLGYDAGDASIAIPIPPPGGEPVPAGSSWSSGFRASAGVVYRWGIAP
jgi:opacity protein-like surface antigen